MANSKSVPLYGPILERLGRMFIAEMLGGMTGLCEYGKDIYGKDI